MRKGFACSLAFLTTVRHLHLHTEAGPSGECISHTTVHSRSLMYSIQHPRLIT